MRGWMLALLLVAPAAVAKPWNGIDPGVSTRADVIGRFGEPSRVVDAGQGVTLAYLGNRAIRGTTQAHFRIEPKTGVVSRIEVFPGPKIDRAVIEQTYGGACPAGTSDRSCYLRKHAADRRVYFDYARLGLVIFFMADGASVHSFVFQRASP